MKRFLSFFLALSVCLVFAPVARANPWSIELFELAFQRDGSLWDWPYSDDWATMPAAVDRSAFDGATGLGTLKVKITATGLYNFAVLFDHEIKDATGVAFYANSGEALGTLPSGMSWEIDEPEIGGWNYKGDIFTNLVNVTLDNQSFFNGTDTWLDPEDAAMALGWELDIPAGGHAIVTLQVTQRDPGEGFRLHQWGMNAEDEIAHLYLQGSARIDQGGSIPEIPEPWQAPLVACAVAAIWAVRHGRRQQQ